MSRLAGIESSDAIAGELYCSVLSRPPEEEEQQELSAYLEAHRDRRTAALADLAWSLLTSTEFRLNH